MKIPKDYICDMPKAIKMGCVTKKEFYGDTGKKCTGVATRQIFSDDFAVAEHYCPTCAEMIRKLAAKDGFVIDEDEPIYEFERIPDKEGKQVMTTDEGASCKYKNDVMYVADLLDASIYHDVYLEKLPDTFLGCTHMAVGTVYDVDKKCWVKFEVPITPKAVVVFENTVAKRAFACIEKDIKVAVACGYKADMIKTLRFLAEQLEATI